MGLVDRDLVDSWILKQATQVLALLKFYHAFAPESDEASATLGDVQVTLSDGRIGSWLGLVRTSGWARFAVREPAVASAADAVVKAFEPVWIAASTDPPEHLQGPDKIPQRYRHWYGRPELFAEIQAAVVRLERALIGEPDFTGSESGLMNFLGWDRGYQRKFRELRDGGAIRIETVTPPGRKSPVYQAWVIDPARAFNFRRISE